MCFSLGALIMWLVIVCAVVAIVKLLLPWGLGAPGAIVAIVILYFLSDIIPCIGLPRLQH